MKLVIEIDKEDFTLIRRVNSPNVLLLTESKAMLAVKNGKPLNNVLDEIKAEIEEYNSTVDNAISEDELKIEGMKAAFADCLYIIDRYKAESEEA